MSTVISVENLSKTYHLGQIGTGTLTNDLKVWWARMRGKPNPLLKIGQTDHGNQDGETLWALKDVSFQVQQGEVLGIIGRNGAGKSTLLKVLSRITAPTSGKVKVKGRIASLLEVGTGFHPELTGRENIYLNGAILGMTKDEVRRKFDEIVDFAEVEKFIDTPVKRYSSGMYVRLAFAVAAHLDPEILLVDEVLAVGDIEFQKKCLGKMGDVAKGGRTVLFVSHNMSAINQLCSRGIFVQKGEIIFAGSTQEVVTRYINSNNTNTSAIINTIETADRTGTGEGRIIRVEFENENGEKLSSFGIGEPFTIKFYAKLREQLSSLVAGAEIKTASGIHLVNLRSDGQGISFGPFTKGSTILFSIRVPGLPFYPGIYKVEPWFCEKKGKRIDHIISGIPIQLQSLGIFKSEFFIQPNRGHILLDCEWTAKDW